MLAEAVVTDGSAGGASAAPVLVAIRPGSGPRSGSGSRSGSAHGRGARQKYVIW